MPDADCSDDRLAFDKGNEVGQPSRRAAPINSAACQGRDASRVIAPVLQAGKSIEDWFDRRRSVDNPENTAHFFVAPE
jgi:hypothetical protein